jgi:hypothetical protein
LGIGTNAPAVALDVRGSLEIARFGTTGSDNYINVKNTTRDFYIGGDSSRAYIWSTSAHPIDFFTANVVRMRLFNTGNLLLQNGGTFTDGGQRLQVQGTTLLNGNTSILSIAGNTTNVEGAAFNADTIDFVITGGRANNSNGVLSVSTTLGNFNPNFGGTKHLINVVGNFQPGTSATGSVNLIGINTTINYPVGATGIQRGLYVNPTLTRATDWRSIEWSNNSGWGLYGAGTAPNFLGGVTTFAERINIEADSNITTQTSSAIVSTTTNANLIISANGTGSLLASIPNGTLTGGNARGNYSLDLQRTRTSASQVTPTYVEYSTILNGRNNTCNGINSQVLNGVGNTINFASYSSVLNGTSCVTNGSYSIASGESCTSNAYGLTHGFNNTNSGSGSISLGWASTVSNNYSFACGFQNQATALSSFVSGYRAIAYLRGQITNGYTPQSWDNPYYGLAQSSELVASSSVVALTSGATTDLTIDGDLIIPLGTNRFWNVEIKYIAIISAITGTATGMSVGDIKSQNVEIALKKYLGTSTLVGGGIYSTAQENSSMSTASLSLSIGGSQNLRLTFTAPTFVGGGSVTCRVVAKVELTEVSY